MRKIAWFGDIRTREHFESLTQARTIGFEVGLAPKSAHCGLQVVTLQTAVRRFG
jgi:hypothetical protein